MKLLFQYHQLLKHHCSPLPKTATLVYNIHNGHTILSSNLFSPSPPPQRELLLLRMAGHLASRRHDIIPSPFFLLPCVFPNVLNKLFACACPISTIAGYKSPDSQVMATVTGGTRNSKLDTMKDEYIKAGLHIYEQPQ